MKQNDSKNSIPLSEALEIFSGWRHASASIEVTFLGQDEADDTVRVSIDGLVTLVDPNGIITISGDGREIELDLRGSHISRAAQELSHEDAFGSFDCSVVLQVVFSSGEQCLVSPSGRVSSALLGRRYAPGGLEWLRGKLSSTSLQRSMRDSSLKLRALSSLERDRVRRGRVSSAPVFLSVMGIVFAVLLGALAVTPLGIPRLFSEMGINPRPLSDPNAAVWVIRQEGNYYCRGSVLAGRQPGKFMKQADALTLGYQPATGRYCGPANPGHSSLREGFLDYLHHLLETSRLLFSSLTARTHSWAANS